MPQLSPALLAGAGIFAFLVSWSGSNAPGGVSDEPDQYIKAIAAGQGDVVGRRVTPAQSQSMDDWLPVFHSILVAYPAAAALARSYTIPSALDPRYLGCANLTSGPATCLERAPPTATAPTESAVSSVGSYQPFVYVLPGIAMRWLHDSAGALLAARVVLVTINALLLLGALHVSLRARPSPVMLAAVLLTITPTAALCMATLSSSGAEIAAAVALWVALLAALHAEGGKSAWLLLLCAGLLLGVSRSTGPAWLLVAIVVSVIYRGARPSLRAVRDGGAMAAAAITVVAAGAIACIVWQLTQQPSYSTSLSTTSVDLVSLTRIIYNLAATVGWGELQQPGLIVAVWGAMLLVFITFAVSRALRNGEPARALATLVLLVITVVVVYAFLRFGSHTGVIQGRWFVALAAGIPILCGWTLTTTGAVARGLHALGVAAPLLVISGLAGAWWYNAHRYAVGVNGPAWFFTQSAWHPLFGWLPWSLIAALGLVLLGGAVLVCARLPQRAIMAASPLATRA